jgi:hypothetical protein
VSTVQAERDDDRLRIFRCGGSDEPAGIAAEFRTEFRGSAMG